MKKRVFHFRHAGRLEHVESEADLSRCLNSYVLIAYAGAFSLELTKGPPAKRWERIIYPLFGLKIPMSCAVLTIYLCGEYAFVTFEENESEWVAVGSGVGIVEEEIAFTTEAGERFPVLSQNCVSKKEGVGLMELFFRLGKKPVGTQWLKAERLSRDR